tara:strand:+ start:300 stop:614 length:315 start_codon:yes stop_codon:yes gene_type:complete
MTKIKIRKKNIVKETKVPTAKGFKHPDSRAPRDVPDFTDEERRFRRKHKLTTSTGRYRVPIKESKVKIVQKAQPTSKWEKGTPERKKSKKPSSPSRYKQYRDSR